MCSWFKFSLVKIVELFVVNSEYSEKWIVEMDSKKMKCDAMRWVFRKMLEGTVEHLNILAKKVIIMRANSDIEFWNK